MYSYFVQSEFIDIYVEGKTEHRSMINTLYGHIFKY